MKLRPPPSLFLIILFAFPQKAGLVVGMQIFFFKKSKLKTLSICLPNTHIRTHTHTYTHTHIHADTHTLSLSSFWYTHSLSRMRAHPHTMQQVQQSRQRSSAVPPVQAEDEKVSGMTWLLRICYMTHSYVCNDSFISVTWLISTCVMAHIYVWKISGMPRNGWQVRQGKCGRSRAVLLISMFDGTRLYVFMTHSYVRHDSDRRHAT